MLRDGAHRSAAAPLPCPGGYKDRPVKPRRHFRPYAISSKIECCTELGRENPSDGEPAYPRASKLFRSDSFCNPLGGSMLFGPFSPSAVFHGTPFNLSALNLAAMHTAGGRNEGRNHDEEPRNS